MALLVFLVIFMSFIGGAFGGGNKQKTEASSSAAGHKTDLLAQRLKKLLKNEGAYADVHFSVEEGNIKNELFPAHKAILSSASEEFASFFRQKASDNDIVVVKDVAIGAFKVMLSYIYTDDLSGLNAHNVIGVLRAAQRYKITGLVKVCINDFSISQLPNVFAAISEARHINREFVQSCMQYIDQNASTLFKTEGFLRIDCKFLEEIFARDQLKTKDGELEIWDAALRWANAQCLQKGIECTGEKQRAELDKALFQIRFPLIKQEDFTTIILPSDVLTKYEQISMYQHYAQANGHEEQQKYRLKFPTQKRTEQKESKGPQKSKQTFTFGQNENALANRMRKLLNNGTFADVYFEIGEGKEKKLLPAHKAIISTASEALVGMINFGAQKTVSLKTISIDVFKLLLEFIYTGNSGGLNGANFLEVLTTAHMYGVDGLLIACQDFPISQLPNVFSALEDARILEQNELAKRCFEYIEDNAHTLLGTDIFLEIDKKLLCEIFKSDHLQLNEDSSSWDPSDYLLLNYGEISIWNAALRWADAQSNSNSRKRTQQEKGVARREALDAALYEIRFPLMKAEDFTEIIVPVGVLTEDEVIGVLQFYAHPKLSGTSAGGLKPLPFPTRGRADPNLQSKEGTLCLEIEKFSEFARAPIGSKRSSKRIFIKGIPVKMVATVEGGNYLGLFIEGTAPKKGQKRSPVKCDALPREYFKNFQNVYGIDIANNESTRIWKSLFEDLKHSRNSKTEDKITLTVRMKAA